MAGIAIAQQEIALLMSMRESMGFGVTRAMGRQRGGWFLARIVLLFMVIGPAVGDERRAVEFRDGAFSGKVVDAASGKPIAGATVALRDRSGAVVAWTKTEAEGRYTVAAPTLKLLQLQPSRRRGLLASLVRGVGQVVAAPVKIAGAAVSGAAAVVKEIKPVETAKAAAVSAVTADPTPVAAQVAGSAAKAVREKAEKKARETAARSVLGERQAASEKKEREKLLPGEVFLSISAPGFQDLQGKAGAYWLEPAAPSGDTPMGPRAWLETAKLAPTGSDKKSEIEGVALQLAEPQLEPSLAPPGAPVKLRVRLQRPAGQPLNVRVFAREDRMRKVVELKLQEENLFAGELVLDPRTSPGDTTVTLVALKAEPVEVDLKESKEDPLLHFAERLDDLDADKPYEFDPRIMASENRLDLKLTILDPEKATPPSATPVAPKQ